MNTYKIAINGLTKNQAWDVIMRVPAGVSFLIHEVPSAVTAPPKIAKRHSIKSGGDIIGLTGKKGQPGTAREKVLVTLEMLEAEHGVGSVTRNMLRDECKRNDVDHTIVYQLLKEGFLQ